jgi:hypothetical protein
MRDLEFQAANLVRQSPGAVLLRHDFAERLNASPSQISRVIRKLTHGGLLIRISVGMYAKTQYSSLSGKVIPASSLPELAREGLRRLNIAVFPSSAERAYNEGRSQQVPTGQMIGVMKPIKRRIGYDNTFVRYERVRVK